jgi:hypothetical protein
VVKGVSEKTSVDKISVCERCVGESKGILVKGVSNERSVGEQKFW